MPVIVADATVLIALTKIARLGILKPLYGQVLIGPAVEQEVVGEGVRASAPEVRQVEAALRDGWIKRARLAAGERKAADRLSAESRLHRGEAESLAIGSARSLMVVIDDKEARSMAAGLGLRYIGTAAVLLQAFAKGLLTRQELEEAVRDLGRVMWLSPDVITEVLRRAREVRK